LRLEREFVSGDPKAKRYVFRHGSLHPAPFSPMGLITTRLVGLKAKLRVVTEPLGYSRPPDREESLADFVERKFGAEVLNNLVDPLVSTIFFGDPHKMGMESAFPALVEWERFHGSLVRGALRARRFKQDALRSGSSSESFASRPDGHQDSLRVTDALPTLGSFRSGMGALPERLAEELKAITTYKMPAESVALSRESGGTAQPAWQIRLAGGELITAECVVLAVPAHAAARLLEGSSSQLASQLKAIEYAPISVVSAAYERSKVANRLEGFGFMVPRREGLHTICTFWNSSLFKGRSPEGTALLTSFAARDTNSALGGMTDEECARVVEAENAHILGISGEPVARLVSRDSPALPQYNVGHSRQVAEIYRILRTLPNLFLAGNFLRGRSVGDCVGLAYRVAEDVHSQLQGQSI
jgi:oxygen-dependent protoporphyrinogen oxidase